MPFADDIWTAAITSWRHDAYVFCTKFRHHSPWNSSLCHIRFRTHSSHRVGTVYILSTVKSELLVHRSAPDSSTFITGSRTMSILAKPLFAILAAFLIILPGTYSSTITNVYSYVSPYFDTLSFSNISSAWFKVAKIL